MVYTSSVSTEPYSGMTTDSLLVRVVVLVDDVCWSRAVEAEETHDVLLGRLYA